MPDRAFLAAVAGPMLQDDETRNSIEEDIHKYIESKGIEAVEIIFTDDVSSEVLTSYELAGWLIKQFCHDLGVKL